MDSEESENKTRPSPNPPGGESLPPSADTTARRSYMTGENDNLRGSRFSRSEADSARTDARGWRSFAASERSLASSITSSASRINDYTQPRMASPNPQVRNEAIQYLSRPADPPSGHEADFKELGLHTNRDVVEKGPEYVDNLNSAADSHEQDAKTLDTQAKQADAAADQMDKYKQALEQRSSNIESIKNQEILGAKKGAADGTVTRPETAGAQGAGSATASGRDGQTITTPDLAVQAANADGKPSDTKVNVASLTGVGDGNGASGASRAPSSVKDELRNALAGGAKEGSGAAGAAPKSAFDDIFQAKEKRAKDAAARSAEADGANSAADAGFASASGMAARGFSLAGSDTDRAVNKLLQGIGSQGSEDRAVFGSIDQTIFSRMKKYLTKAQADKRVGN